MEYLQFRPPYGFRPALLSESWIIPYHLDFVNVLVASTCDVNHVNSTTEGGEKI